MNTSAPATIHDRITRIREELAGPRGKAAFAKMLGIPASTYDYYEASRIPPADVLVRIAEVAGVDLQWLLTGESGGGVAVDNPVLQRAAKLLADHPDAAMALSAFVEILTARMGFPDQSVPSAGVRADRDDALPSAQGQPVPAAPVAGEAPQVAESQEASEAWIPVLGRSAAGLPQFWADPADAEGITTLAQLIARHCTRPGRQSVPAQLAESDSGQQERSVQIVTLRGDREREVVQFVASADIKRRYSDAFAVRIDGESMTPSIRHGDLVVLSPSQPAEEARAAVVQLKGQIGVTCKLYSTRGDMVHLVPVNEQFSPRAVPAEQVEWALRVVARIRP